MPTWPWPWGGCTCSLARRSRGGPVPEGDAAPRRDDTSPAPGEGRPRPSPRGSARTRKRAGELDRVIHERVRLGIVSALAVNETLSFSDLKRLLGTSDGNLSVHARRLEEAGYVECTKSFRVSDPLNDYRITAVVSLAHASSIDHMEALIRHVRDP